MYFRPAILALFAALIFTAGTGCQKSESSVPVAAPPTTLSPDTIAHVHWVGKRRLDLEADAYYFSRVWSLPETARLQSQTFGRLATGLWRPLLGETAASQIPAGVLRPLFDDLAQEETYLEISAPTGAPPCLVLAVHVSAARAGIWETNLAITAELLAGRTAIAAPAIHSWTIQRTNAPDCIALNRVGEWTVVSVGPEQNPLSAEITARIQRDHAPFFSTGTNLWLEADFDPARVADFFGMTGNLPKNLPRVTFNVTGDGGNVITRGRLVFPEPLPSQLEPWRIPLELIHEPLTGFTAVRGIQPWLADSPAWRDLQIGAPPDQIFFWSLAGSPYQIYLAALLPDVSDQLSALADRLLRKGNPWLAAHDYISFDRASDSNGVTWGNLPDIKPFIKSAGAGSADYLFAGLLPDNGADTNLPPPAGMIQDVLRRANLVYYDWEVTGPRLEPWLHLGQFARQITRRAQMPVDSAGLRWVAVLVPRLGTSATVINFKAPDQLAFVRRSTLGFTAPELHLLVDWLESPEFPCGLHSSLAR